MPTISLSDQAPVPDWIVQAMDARIFASGFEQAQAACGPNLPHRAERAYPGDMSDTAALEVWIDELSGRR
jgi:hypothetical protein